MVSLNRISFKLSLSLLFWSVPYSMIPLMGWTQDSIVRQNTVNAQYPYGVRPMAVLVKGRTLGPRPASATSGRHWSTLVVSL